MEEPTTPKQDKRPKKKKEVAEDKTPTERANQLTATLTGRFTNLINVAAAAPLDGATKEVAAADALRLEIESQAVVCSVVLALFLMLTSTRFVLRKTSFS